MRKGYVKRETEREGGSQYSQEEMCKEKKK